MNLELFNVATQGVTALGTLLINEDQVRLNKHAVGLLSLTDEELRAACRRALRGEDVQEPRGGESLLPSSVSMEVEEVSGNLKVKADCGASPHVYGILCAWLLYEFLNLGGVAARVSLSPPPLAFTLAAAYFAVVAGNIAYTMGRKFSAEMWQADLNARLHTLKDVRNDAELRQKLGGLRRRLLRRALAFQLLVLAGVFYLMYAVVLPGTTFPLSLLIVFASFLFGVSSRQFGLQLYKLLYNRAPLDIEVLDFSKVPEGKEERQALQHLKRAAKILFAVLITVYGFFEVVTVTYQILQKLGIMP